MVPKLCSGISWRLPKVADACIPLKDYDLLVLCVAGGVSKLISQLPSFLAFPKNLSLPYSDGVF